MNKPKMFPLFSFGLFGVPRMPKPLQIHRDNRSDLERIRGDFKQIGDDIRALINQLDGNETDNQEG